MHNINILHFDTLTQWDVQNPTSIFYKSGFHPFHLNLNLPYQLTNIKKIYLKSVEIPIGYTNIRDGNTSNILSMTINNINTNESYDFTIKLSNKNYSSIQSLLTDINNLINNTVTHDYKPNFSVIGQKVYINVPTSFITFSFNDTVLSKNILGFSYNYYIFLGTSYEAVSNFNIQYDTYICLNFPKLSHKSNGVYKTISFKIPTNTNYTSIYFNYENISFSQYIELFDSAPIGNLEIQINDRFGFPINNNGLDWSFSLGFEKI